MHIKLKNGIYNCKGKIAYGAAPKPKELQHVVQIQVDPKQKVEVNGQGIHQIQRIEPDKKIKFAKFATFKL